MSYHAQTEDFMQAAYEKYRRNEPGRKVSRFAAALAYLRNTGMLEIEEDMIGLYAYAEGGEYPQPEDYR